MYWTSSPCQELWVYLSFSLCCFSQVRRSRKPPRTRLNDREAQICRRLAEARQKLGIDQAEAARRIGIPKSTLASYELCIVSLKAAIALRICRKLILSEEWLATGSFKITEKVGLTKGIKSSEGMEDIYIRQCMDLLSSPEAESLSPGALFSESFDQHLAAAFEERIGEHFYFPGIPVTAWENRDTALGRDIAVVIIERALLLLKNEELVRKSSPQGARTAYLGLIIRMAIFGYRKCMGDEVDVAAMGLSPELFTSKNTPIEAFKPIGERRKSADVSRVAVNI